MHGNGRDAYLDEGMCGFITKFARRNYWRVSSYYDLDDLIQDGLMCFAKCRHRYVDVLKSLPEQPTTPDHRKIMMSLVMTAFARHVHGLSSDRTERADECCFSDAGREDADFGDDVARIAPAPPGPESMVELLAGAPREVADLFKILAGDAVRAAAFVRDVGGRRETRGQHVKRLDASNGMIKPMRVRRPWRGPDGRFRKAKHAVRETTNEFYCRLLGLDSRTHDVRKIVRDYLS